MVEGLQQQENKRRDEKGRFIKGVSGNPKGRPEGKHSESISNLLRKRLDEFPPGALKSYKEMIVDGWLLTLINRRDKSHILALREALDRLEGKPIFQSKIDITAVMRETAKDLGYSEDEAVLVAKEIADGFKD